MIFQRQM